MRLIVIYEDPDTGELVEAETSLRQLGDMLQISSMVFSIAIVYDYEIPIVKTRIGRRYVIIGFKHGKNIYIMPRTWIEVEYFRKVLENVKNM